MKKIILTVEVTEEDLDSIVEAAKSVLPTWGIEVQDVGKVEDGYYWSTNIEFGARQIIEVIDEEVYVMGDDRTSKQEEFSNYQKIRVGEAR